jgi:hypothetical protein
MLGSAEEWFYRGLGGINVNLSREGAQRLVLHPVLAGKIQWARAHYRSVLGEVESEWHRGATETVYNFTIPATVNGVPTARAPGVLETHIEGASMEMTAGSGKYEVRVANLAP